MRLTAVVGVACVLVGLPSAALAQRVDIFTALQEGTIWAEFRGNGDSSVIASIGRTPGGPTEVVIPAGSIFRVAQAGGRWRQFGMPGGYGGYRGGYGGFGGIGGRGPGGFGQRGGRQGMFGYRSTSARLSLASATTLLIPTLCMDYNKPAPTRRDLMVIMPPPERYAALAAVLDETHPPQPAAQLAMWAVANDAPPTAASRYLVEIIPGSSEAIAGQRKEIIAIAADILRAAGLEPERFRLFR